MYSGSCNSTSRVGGNTGGFNAVNNVGTGDNTKNLQGVCVVAGYKGIVVVQAQAGRHLGEGGGHFRVRAPLGWATRPARMQA